MHTKPETDPSDSLENRVAMHVTGLASEVLALISLAKSPEAAKLIAQDIAILTGAHYQLGRVLARLPVSQTIAAE